MNKKFSEQKFKEGIKFLHQNDPIISVLIEKLGTIKFTPNSNHFEVLVNSILSQQLSTKSYNSIRNRFHDKVDLITPQNIIKTKDKEILSCGVSSNKLSYIKEISESVINKKLDFKLFHSLCNEDIINELIKIKGIGVWTSKMFLISSLGRLNVLPHEDVGIQNSIRKFYNLEEKPSTSKIIELGLKWGDFSSISSLYLWKGLDSKLV